MTRGPIIFGHTCGADIVTSRTASRTFYRDCGSVFGLLTAALAAEFEDETMS
jgi:hypothetical protein